MHPARFPTSPVDRNGGGTARKRVPAGRFPSFPTLPSER